MSDTTDRRDQESAGGASHRGPRLGAEGEARRREREARLAEALRANLRRRKLDTGSRAGRPPRAPKSAG
ncbi:MAG TPA: hypothetical protein VKY65_00065 [Alphaproteobacteria bacterium]|nr:hypothetical protein [Alphaproteobacteria bacterium]